MWRQVFDNQKEDSGRDYFVGETYSTLLILPSSVLVFPDDGREIEVLKIVKKYLFTMRYWMKQKVVKDLGTPYQQKLLKEDK